MTVNRLSRVPDVSGYETIAVGLLIRMDLIRPLSVGLWRWINASRSFQFYTRVNNNNNGSCPVTEVKQRRTRVFLRSMTAWIKWVQWIWMRGRRNGYRLEKKKNRRAEFELQSGYLYPRTQIHLSDQDLKREMIFNPCQMRPYQHLLDHFNIVMNLSFAFICIQQKIFPGWEEKNEKKVYIFTFYHSTALNLLNSLMKSYSLFLFLLF